MRKAEIMLSAPRACKRVCKCDAVLLLIIAVFPPVTAMRNILDPMLATYDSTARPSDSEELRHNQPFNASCSAANGAAHDEAFVDLGLENLVSVDERKLTLHLDGYIRGYWTDSRLQFGPSVCRDQIVLSSLTIRNSDEATLWSPGYYIQEAVKVEMGGGIEGEAVFIDRDGSVFWSRRLRLELSCPNWDPSQLPWDIQFCLLTIGVYRYKATQVRLSWHKTSAYHGIDVIASEGLRSGEWLAGVVEVREANKD